MGFFNERSDQMMLVIVLSMIIGAFVVVIGGLVWWYGKFVEPGLVNDVVVAEMSVELEVTRFEEGESRARLFCDGIKEKLLERGVEGRFVRVHAVEVARVEEGGGLGASILLSVRRQHKVGAVDVNEAIGDVHVGGVEVVSLRSGVRSFSEYRAWLHAGGNGERRW